MNLRIKTCPTCQREFTYEIARGRDRKHCSAKCSQHLRAQRIKERYVLLPKCKVDRCSNRANRIGSQLCEACYCQIRRSGTTVRARRRGYTIEYTTGYIAITAKGHPLADKYGSIRVHRLVLHRELGDGPHPCKWCGQLLEWKDICVDHLNDIKADNRAENLVVSCNACNRARGQMIPFVKALGPESMELFIKTLGYMREDAAATQRKLLDALDYGSEGCHRQKNRKSDKLLPGASAFLSN